MRHAHTLTLPLPKALKRHNRFTVAEKIELAEDPRDIFYQATVGENGWPYVQNRGGLYKSVR